ncbi:hypothetical protein Tco_1100097 [Tanacetum coccineum]
MVALTFADSHNMVAYLEKSEANADFAEIVDFLNVSPISCALTVSPTIYVSYIEQFWSTIKIKTVNNETQIHAKVDGKTIVITESSVRRDLHFDDEDAVFNDEYDTPSHTKKVFANMRRKGKDFSGTVTPLFPSMLASQAVEGEDEAVHKERGDSVERAATIVASLDAEQDNGGSPRCQEAIGDTIAQTRSERVSTPSYDSPLLGVNTPRSDEEIIELKELMDMCTKLSDRVLNLDNVKDAQALEIKNLKKRGRNSDNIEELNVAEDEHMFDLSDLAGIEVVLKEEPIELVEDTGSAKKGISAIKDKVSTADLVTTACETITTASVNPDDVALAETLMAIRSSASRPQKLKGVLFKETSEPTTITTSRPQPQIPAKDKGKGIMLEREREKEASNAALIEEWDSIEARIDANA